MGKINVGILGKVFGKVGPVVGASWKGQNTLRAYQPVVRNPQTDAQVAQRNRFATTVGLVKEVLPLINEVYAGSLTNMSPFNKITSINVKNAFTGTPAVLDHSLVSLCHFVGSKLSNVTLTGFPDQEMKITWDPNTQNAEELASNLTFVLFNCRTNKAIIFRDAAIRNDGVAIFIASVSWVGDFTALHVVTTDHSQTVSNKPMKLISFAAGNDLSGQVK